MEILRSQGCSPINDESRGMTHRAAHRLVGGLVKALAAYGFLMALSLVIGLVFFAFFHEPPPD